MQTRFPFSISPYPINQRGRLFHFYLCSCLYAMSAPHVPLYEPHSLFSCALSAVRKWVDLLFSRIKTEPQPTPCLPYLPPTTPRIITSTTPSAAPLLAASSQRVPVIQRHHLRISTWNTHTALCFPYFWFSSLNKYTSFWILPCSGDYTVNTVGMTHCDKYLQEEWRDNGIG